MAEVMRTAKMMAKAQPLKIVITMKTLIIVTTKILMICNEKQHKYQNKISIYNKMN